MSIFSRRGRISSWGCNICLKMLQNGRYYSNMQGKYIPRYLENDVCESLEEFPAAAILGPRQCGKTTLAKHIIEQQANSIYLDLERPSDVRKLSEPELFFDMHKDKLICLDEIQRTPDIFPVLRSVIDERERPGQFLILGAATTELLRQSSETLAGRISYLELTPFLLPEPAGKELSLNWLRGGFPGSILSKSDKASFRWRQNSVRTFLERDIPQLGIQIPSGTIERLWRMCAHFHAQILNLSSIGASLGISHHSVRSYIEILSRTFMLRVLPPLEANVKKRLVKSPRIYLRDTGMLHFLLEIDRYENLMAHPVFGASWEGFVIEQVLGVCSSWRPSFYRTATGAELDLVLERGARRIVLECKASASPQVTRGFWNALEVVKPDEVWVAALVKEAYPIEKRVMVAPLMHIIEHLSHMSS